MSEKNSKLIEYTVGTVFARLCQICGTKLCLACLKMSIWNSRCVDEAKARIWRYMEKLLGSRHGLNKILLEAATCLQTSGIPFTPNPFWSWKLLNCLRMFEHLPGPDRVHYWNGVWSWPIKEFYCGRQVSHWSIIWSCLHSLLLWT